MNTNSRSFNFCTETSPILAKLSLLGIKSSLNLIAITIAANTILHIKIENRNINNNIKYKNLLINIVASKNQVIFLTKLININTH